MERQVVYTPAAIRALKKIDAVSAKRIRAKIASLAVDPDALGNQVKRLTGSPLSRLRAGDYRVIFGATLEILTIVKIGHRGMIYE